MRVLMRRRHDWQAVVDFDVRIPATQADAQSGRRAIEPLVIPATQHAAHHVPGACHLQLPGFGQALANQQCLVSVHFVHHREIVLADVLPPVPLACIGYAPFACLPVLPMYVVLRTSDSV